MEFVTVVKSDIELVIVELSAELEYMDDEENITEISDLIGRLEQLLNSNNHRL